MDPEYENDDYENDGADVSEYDDEPDPDDEPSDGMTDAEADADVLRMIGHGNDEDYGYASDVL